MTGLKVSKRSTVRNRVKRLIREAVRRHLPSMQLRIDLVISAKPTIIGRNYAQISQELGDALRRARLIRGPWVDILRTDGGAKELCRGDNADHPLH